MERETHSPFYQEAVSYALLKVTELGLVPAAEILLEFGADLSFEGKTGEEGAGPGSVPCAGQEEPGGKKLPWEAVIAGAEREGAASSDPHSAGTAWMCFVAALVQTQLQGGAGGWPADWEVV